MKRIIIILLVIVGIGTTAFTAFEPLKFDGSVKTVEALGQQGSNINSFISGVPLAVGVSEMSADTGSLVSPPLITLLIVALGLITTAAIVWDRQPIPINQS